VPQVGRASRGRGAKKDPRARSKYRDSVSVPVPRKKVSNWANAQLRGARYRAGHALRLGAIAVLAIGGIVIGGLAAFGQLDGVGGMAESALSERLANAGFTVRAVEVSGGGQISPQRIADIIGARPGTGLLDLDPAEARERVEALPWVSEASVVRLWPDRIAVLLIEREPYALWQTGGYHRVIDREGVVIAGANPVDYADLPRVVGAGANEDAAEILELLALQPNLRRITTHVVRVGERRWNLRLATGGDVMLPEGDPAAALATIATLHANHGVLDLDAQSFDIRGEGELAIRAWPERADPVPERGA
jgi:cell division protein FtsQ